MFHLIVVLSIISTVWGSAILPRPPMLDGRIVGGEDVQITQYPYQVSVRLLGSHVCGGSILNENYVVTASHCIYNLNPAYYSIAYGISNIRTEASRNVITAAATIKHPNYNSNTIDFDVALIRLQKPIPFSSLAQPINLASVQPRAGDLAVVTGWGTTAENGVTSDNLQMVQVQIVDRGVCDAQYYGVNDITERMICAGVNGGGKDACQGIHLRLFLICSFYNLLFFKTR